MVTTVDQEPIANLISSSDWHYWRWSWATGEVVSDIATSSNIPKWLPLCHAAATNYSAHLPASVHQNYGTYWLL